MRITLGHLFTSMYISSSLRVPGENPQMIRDYQDCLPAKPRILNPINIFDNLYKTGLRMIKPQSKDSDRNRWREFNKEIARLDLSIHRPEALHPQHYI